MTEIVDAFFAWMRTHGAEAEALAREAWGHTAQDALREQRQALARGYAWGRVDMRDLRCVDVQAFADAYASAYAACDAGDAFYMPSIQNAYETWVCEHRIVHRHRRVAP